MRLLGKMISISIRSQMQHRISFILEIIANFCSSLTDLVGIWVLIDRFHIIQGWPMKELAILYGIIHMGFAIGECSARGFDTFGHMIKSGDFDRVLLRPLGTIFQIATRQVQAFKFGRFLQGFLVLLWGAHELRYTLFSLQSGVIFAGVLGTACLFYGLFVIQATLSFWTVETIQLMHITTYGGREVGQFPMSIFPTAFQLFFTMVIPLACVAYYPTAALHGHVSIPLWMALLSPLCGGAFLFLSCRLWQLGVRHYHSTGN